MSTLAVIIPYFQRDGGILRKAIRSVLEQRMPCGLSVSIVVVDDGSPAPAGPELNGLSITDPFTLEVIQQENKGVAEARNAGLRRASSAEYIAFLDSDDAWQEDHIERALATLELGSDVYFCDNKRVGHHESYFAASPLLTAFIDQYRRDTLFIGSGLMQTLLLREFVSQISTIVYRRSIAPDLLFPVYLRYAGEDTIFLMTLISRAGVVSFSTADKVTCGKGVNLYFSNLNWDSPGNVRRAMDAYNAHCVIQHEVALSAENRKWNKSHTKKLRNAAIYFVCRRVYKRTRGLLP